MGGIAALFHPDGRVADPASVRSMLEAAPYRGPDGMAVLGIGPVALGYASFAVTVEQEQERQPATSPRTGCILAADVRLDNRQELKHLLGCISTQASDAELILLAYERWGLDALPRLLGDFALLLWDPRRRRLLGARDTSGQRTLFYRADAHVLAAASEIQQVLQDPEISIAPDAERIRDFLTPINMFRNEKDHPTTFYAGISALPAGHYFALDPNGLEIRRYWDLIPQRELRYRDDRQYAEHYRDLLSTVVRSRLRSSRPTGYLLSGGLDSSSIACTAQELYRRGDAETPGFVSFSAVFEGLECDERPYIEDVESKYGLTAMHFDTGTLAGRLQLEPSGFLEEPNLGVAAGRDAIFGAAGAAGVRVLLTGDIADSCVGGSPLVFDSLLRHGSFGRLLSDFRRYRLASREPLLKTLAIACIAPLLPLKLQQRIMRTYILHAARDHEGHLLPPWMPEPLRRELSSRNLRLSLQREGERRYSSPARQLEYDLLYPPEVVRHPVPWPLEIWRPFADRRLHEFLLSIPPEQKYRPHPTSDGFYAGSKHLVRLAMRDIVPDSIRLRTTKTYFTEAFRQELRLQWPLYEAAFGPSARPEIARQGYVDRAGFWSRLSEVWRGDQANDLVYLMHLIGLETWLRTFSLPRTQLSSVSTAV